MAVKKDGPRWETLCEIETGSLTGGDYAAMSASWTGDTCKIAVKRLAKGKFLQTLWFSFEAFAELFCGGQADKFLAEVSEAVKVKTGEISRATLDTIPAGVLTVLRESGMDDTAILEHFNR